MEKKGKKSGKTIFKLLIIFILLKINGGEKIRKITAILCVMVFAINIVPSFAADTNNTTTSDKQVKHPHKHHKELKNTKKMNTKKINSKNYIKSIKTLARNIKTIHLLNC